MPDATRVAELKAAIETKQAFIREGLQNGVKVDGNNVTVSKEDAEALKGAMSDIAELKGLVQMEMVDTEVKSFFDGIEAPQGTATAVAAAAAAAEQSQQPMDLGTRFTKSDTFQHFAKTGRLTMDEPFKIDGERDIVAQGGYGQKDIWTGTLTGATNPTGFGRVQFDPMVPRPQRATRVRDLFPVATTSANLIDYFRVLGFTTGTDARGNAAPVADWDEDADPEPTFGMKPKSQLKFEAAQAPVRTIAHWEAAHRNVIMDEPQLQATINNELLYGLALAEDDQILNGDGQGENLRGILQTTGVQPYSQQAGDRMSDALRRAATLVALANFPATGYVLHPFDWESVELQKATGDGQYMLVTNVSIGAAMTVWRQPVVETPAIAEGHFLTGAWGLGAQLYDRMQANVRIAEQHADFFVRNAVAILAEERLALAVKRPEAFVHGQFATS